MKYVIVLILVVAAYIAGYITPKENTHVIATVKPAAISTKSHIRHGELSKQPVTVAEKIQASQPVVDAKTEFDTETDLPAPTESASIAKPQSAAAPVIANGSSGSNASRPLSDEQIDKLVPAPFNQHLKGHDAALLERYRKFAEQENPSNQDRDILNKISDAIASNPYSKFLNIESFQCKANLCEIRLYESKPGVWSYIQAEMSLQDWWKFQSSSAAGFGTGKENINGWYVLLTRD